MKVVAIDGSPRKDSNSQSAIEVAKREFELQGIAFETLKVGNKEVRGCIACGSCYKTGECILADDNFRAYTKKMEEADGLLLVSPVYYAGIAGTMKSFLDRAFYISQGKYRHKIGGAIGVARRDGGITTFDQLNKYFLISEMVVAPSSYWTSVHGGAPGEVLQDTEGVDTIKVMAQNMAWLMKMKEATKETVPAPEKATKRYMNFVR